MFSLFLYLATVLGSDDNRVLASPQSEIKVAAETEKPTVETGGETAMNADRTKNGDWPIQRPEFKQGPVVRCYLNNEKCWGDGAFVLEGEYKGKIVPYRRYAEVAYGDPYGFTAWLNNYRAQNGRRPVGFDSNLAAWAAVNNGEQHARGMGHHVMGSARRQNSGMGAAQSVWSMWTISPAHQAALLDPTITMIGIAASGAYWTFNAW